MHPFLNSQLATYHLQELQREAVAVRRADAILVAESASRHIHLPNFLRFWHDSTRLSLRHPVVLEEAHPEAVNIEEIKPALVSTFSVMHNVGLISEYDDQFVEKFVQTFERELEHQSVCR